MRVCCFTSLTLAYAARAMVLAETLRQAHPGWTIVAVLVDRPGNGPAPLPGFDEVVSVNDLDIPGLPGWLFKHDVVEACTAVKGAMMCRLLAGPYDAVIYLDPDIAVFNPLEEVEAALANADIVLTPHQTTPNTPTAAIKDNELGSLLYGTYNLGFIAVRNGPTGKAFAAWWASMLHRACYDEPEAGLFTDQRYIDLVPGLFDGVRVLRHPGCNVASWNLSTRRVTITADGAILVNGEPLRFFHFTKAGSIGDLMMDRNAGDNVEAFELLACYKRRLHHYGQALVPAPWAYGHFTNGVPIPREARRLFRARRDLMAYFADPFDAGLHESYYGWLHAEHPGMLADSAAIAAA